MNGITSGPLRASRVTLKLTDEYQYRQLHYSVFIVYKFHIIYYPTLKVGLQKHNTADCCISTVHSVK